LARARQPANQLTGTLTSAANYRQQHDKLLMRKTPRTT